MKSKLLFITFFTACLALTTSCGSTKGYSGAKLSDNEVAIIQGGSNKLRVKNKKTSETAFIARVDTVTVGSYMKGWPKQVRVKPGDVTVEIQHFCQWKDNAATKGAAMGAAGALGGLIGGAIVGSAMASNNPHMHYKLTFNTEQGRQYTIMPQTEPETETARFTVTDNSTNDTIPVSIVRIEKQPKKKK